MFNRLDFKLNYELKFMLNLKFKIKVPDGRVKFHVVLS